MVSRPVVGSTGRGVEHGGHGVGGGDGVGCMVERGVGEKGRGFFSWRGEWRTSVAATSAGASPSGGGRA